MGTGSFPGGRERPGRDADPSPPSSAVGHERVELYLYSLYGPYGLYRASVPVQGCTLPLPTAQYAVVYKREVFVSRKSRCMAYEAVSPNDVQEKLLFTSQPNRNFLGEMSVS